MVADRFFADAGFLVFPVFPAAALEAVSALEAARGFRRRLFWRRFGGCRPSEVGSSVTDRILAAALRCAGVTADGTTWLAAVAS